MTLSNVNGGNTRVASPLPRKAMGIQQFPDLTFFRSCLKVLGAGRNLEA
jgi:hypothetical protein